MNKNSQSAKWWLAGIAALILMAATVPLAVWVTRTSSAQIENTRRRCEDAKPVVHKVVIKQETVSPKHTSASLCDELVITNGDNKARLIALGQHDKHISYNGVSEKLVKPGESLKLTLGHSGTYLFHDHANENVKGTFTVPPPAR